MIHDQRKDRQIDEPDERGGTEVQQEIQFLRRMFVAHRVAQFPEEPQHNHGTTHQQDTPGPGLELTLIRNNIHLRAIAIPEVQQHVESAVRNPNGHENYPSRSTDFLSSHSPSFREEQQNQHEGGLKGRRRIFHYYSHSNSFVLLHSPD